MPSLAPPCVLVVADPERIAELVAPLAELPGIEVVVGAGGDDTLELFAAKKPAAVVVTATLDAGDCSALVDALRAAAPRAEVGIVLVGDDTGPIRTALDALEIAPERFVSRPLAANALRFAVTSALEGVALAKGATGGAAAGQGGTMPGLGGEPVRAPAKSSGAIALPIDDGPTTSQRAALRARWEALADSFVDDDEDDAPPLASPPEPPDEPAPLPPLVTINPRRREPTNDIAPLQAWRPGTTDQIAPAREPTLILNEHAPVPASAAPPSTPTPPPLRIEPRVPRLDDADRTANDDGGPVSSRTRTGDDSVVIAARDNPEDRWSDPLLLPDVPDGERDSLRDLTRAQPRERDDLGIALDDFDDDLVLADEPDDPRLAPRAANRTPPPLIEPDDFDRPTLDGPLDRAAGPASTEQAEVDAALAAADVPAPPPDDEPPAGRDFARQLRAKMSVMAQRLFQGGGAAPDVRPRHDHHTEIDLATLGDEPALGGGVTEIEARSLPRTPDLRADLRAELRDVVTSPGGWDTHVRERGLPDAGELVRGVSDAPMLLAKMFAQSTTGQIAFARDAVEKVVYFDQGRPVFASSNEPRDRMGELLVREGKITTSQYERCQAIVVESGRRMGEILVDLGYLKRRELLPAVRRHVEDVIYSLFGWERGHYRITVEQVPSSERIRLSRHAAAIVLEGVRRKLDRTSLERLIGPPSTVIEVPDRERLGGIVNTSDLSAEERAALAAFDGQADLAQVARTAGVELGDVLPLAWGLCALGLATWRRTDTEVPDESTALVGETDLVIDRERVRARWQLVTEADYFALLGVRRDATAFEIRRAYQSARRDFAADCFPQDLRRELAHELADIANVLDEAFRVLRDDRLRVTYLSNLVG